MWLVCAVGADSMADQSSAPRAAPGEGIGSADFGGSAAAKDGGLPDAKRMRVMGEAGGSLAASQAPSVGPPPLGERAELGASVDRALPAGHAGVRPTPWPALPKKPPGDASSPTSRKGASGKRSRANAAMEGFYPGFVLPGPFLPGQFAPGAMHWLGMMPPAAAGGSKKSQALLQQQQLAMWQQHEHARMAFWQQQQQQQQQQRKQAKGSPSTASEIQSKLLKAKKLFNRDKAKQQESFVHHAAGGIPLYAPAKDRTQDSGLASNQMQQPGIGAGDGAAAHPGSMDGMGAEPQMPTTESKMRRIWDKFDEASEDLEKLEAFILEVLHDQPTILAAAVDAESGQSVRQATVMRAVYEARPMLNLLVGILSKYVPVEAWNREVRPMCEQLQSIFGKPGLFCGHAQGAKELKAAELVRNPPENATQRKGRDGRTPKGEGEGVVSMYGKRLVQSCRCDSSKCLKMYCTCFRNETRCNSSCVCMECHNDGLHEEERMAAMRVHASQIKKPRVEASKLQQQAALLAATQDAKKPEKERKRRGRAYTKAQIKAATKFVRDYDKKFQDDGDVGEGEIHKYRDIPRTGTFENEETWASFCALTGEVNHRAVNLWDRVQRDMKKKSSVAAGVLKNMPANLNGAPSQFAPSVRNPRCSSSSSNRCNASGLGFRV